MEHSSARAGTDSRLELVVVDDHPLVVVSEHRKVVAVALIY